MTDAPTTSRERLEDSLVGEPLSTGYQATLPIWSLWTLDTVPQIYLYRDVELMLIHPVVINSLNYFKGGIAGAEFWGGPNHKNPDDTKGLPICPGNDAVSTFVLEHCQRFWDRGVPLVQGGYEYGWIGCENLYETEGNMLKWQGLVQFSPRDCFLLTQGSLPIGVRVKSIRGDGANQKSLKSPKAKGYADLWLASDDVPAKGLWYAHQPRYNNFYGQSQLVGAWRPWRRLAWKDAAETVADGGVYRFAYAGPIVKYPQFDPQVAPPGPPGTTLDSQGNPRRYARDVARQICEWFKAGAGVGIPSDQYPPEQGGGDKWSLELPKTALNISGLIEYIKHLWQQINYGVGVPPELLEAAESGSGYSGRRIPLEGFLMVQQRLADALLKLFLKQVLEPLVKWNFGDVKFNVMVKPLLQTKTKMLQEPQQRLPGQQPQQPGKPGAKPEEYVGPRGGIGKRDPVTGKVKYGGFSLAYHDAARMRARSEARELAERILRVA